MPGGVTTVPGSMNQRQEKGREAEGKRYLCRVSLSRSRLGRHICSQEPSLLSQREGQLFRCCLLGGAKERKGKRTLWVSEAHLMKNPHLSEVAAKTLQKAQVCSGEFYGIPRDFLRNKYTHKKERITVRICLGSEGFFY